MKQTSKGFLPDEGAFPFEGLDSTTPTTQMTPGSSTHTVNLSTFRGTITKRAGYSQLGTSLINEPVIRLFTFYRADGVNLLIAWTLTKVYSYDGATWTDRTPSYPAGKFTGLSGGNGWAITSGAISDGQYVFQTTTSGITAVGQISKLASDWYVIPTYGMFDNTAPLTVSSAFGAGTLTLTGTDPNSTSVTIAKFAVLSAGVGWAISPGTTFTPGDTVIQANSGIVGIYAGSDGSFFYFRQGGTFNNTDTITNTTSGRVGTLTATGTSGSVATTTRRYPLSAGRGQFFYYPRTENDFVDVTNFTDVNLGRLVIFSDGRNPPAYWNGVDSTFKLLPMNFPTFCLSKTCGVLNSYLVFANVTAIGEFEPQSAIWCDTGNCQEWLLGNSGVLAEMNFEGEILRIIPFSDKLIVFSRNTIGCICYIDPNVIFGSQIYVTGTKVAGPQSICNVNPYLVYAGQDNIYIWDGGAAVSPIGDRIAVLYRQFLNKSNVFKTNLFFDLANAQVRLNVPTSSSTCATLVLEVGISSATFYDSQKSSKTRWFQHTYNDRPVSFTSYPVSSTGQNYLATVIGSDAGKVFIQQSETDDSGVAIPLVWDTVDFTIPKTFQSQFARWLELEYEASGSTIDLYYSIDHGTNWVLIETDTLSSTLGVYKAYFDTTSRTIRFRFFSSVLASSFTLSWFRTWFRPGGAR